MVPILGQVAGIVGLNVLVPSPLQEIEDPRLADRDVRLYLKRDDLIHPDIPGNKWRKLRYNLEYAAEQGFSRILTFGGAYSNHIRATAAAGKLLGFSTIGVIRGEEHLPLNPMLSAAVRFGMQLTYMDRETYRNKQSREVEDSLRKKFGPDFYLIPEGGSNALAVKGCAELPEEISADYGFLCCPCGTGGTLAGIAGGMRPDRKAIGFSALKGGDFLVSEVSRLQEKFGRTTDNWTIETHYHFGGFAKRNRELDDFIIDFRERHGIQLEWVYVGKMLYGIFDLVDKGQFARGTKIVAVLTGPSYSRIE